MNDDRDDIFARWPAARSAWPIAEKAGIDWPTFRRWALDHDVLIYQRIEALIAAHKAPPKPADVDA